LPHLLRRVAALTALSVIGIALLAPLSARSALPDPVAAADRLLAGTAGPAAFAQVDTAVARSALSIRDASAAGTTDGAEPVAAQPLPTPASAPMEATIMPNAPAVAPAPQVAAVYAAGDTVWDELAQCESSGNWAANTGNGYYGGLQFSYGTWHGYGGGGYADYPHQATREQQIAVAERLRDARGYQPWPACRAKLGLP
jgi:resuscitation-promoting factor RpfB